MSSRNSGDLDRRVAKLYKQGILVGGESPHEPQRPSAYIPAFLKRFLERGDKS